ncbi:MAG: transglutaminaseTgpA domain-containing protein [Friedmanniella sp.]
MRSTDRTTLAVVLALFLAGFILAPLTSDLSYLGASWGFLVVLGATTILLRRARIGNGLVLLAQLGVAGLLSVALSSTMPGLGLPWYEHYVGLWRGGVLHMQEQASPMEPNDGVTLIFATIIAVLMILTELLAVGLGRPAWALAPPATLFLVPALGLGTDTGLMSFLLVALGYLGILVADGLNGTSRWTRGLSRDSAESVGATPVVWRAASLIGLPTLASTLVLGAVLPTFNLSGLGFGSGTGGNGPLQLTDPSLDLRRNLNQPQNKEVIDYQTDAPGGLYLRLASLPLFNAQGWSNVQIRLNSGDQMPQVPGLSTTPDRQFTTRISVRDFRSQYLPMPYAPRSFEAAGDWRYDANSLTVVNGDNRAEALANLTYTVRSVDVAPEPDALDDAATGAPVDESVTGNVPSDLPDDLVQLSKQVIQDADTPAAKAAAIQAYLRSSRFTYSVEPLPGSGYRALENFLLRDRRGYCEQFATAMAMMARVADIPSRVSVGFLPGRRDGNTWRVSIRDMHAWPELYFAGYGWVRFEPTPAVQTGSAPPWTLQNTDNPSDSPSDVPSASATESAPAPSAAPTDVPTEQTAAQDTTGSFPWARTLIGTGAGLLVLALLAAPATIRKRRRGARLSGDQLADDQVEAAWAEIRDTVLDYGGSWPSGTPRVIGSEIGHQLDQEESVAMGQVATLVERSRYARSLGDDSVTAALPQLTNEIRRGLAAPLTRRRRLLGLVLPRSLFRRPPQA